MLVSETPFRGTNLRLHPYQLQLVRFGGDHCRRSRLKSHIRWVRCNACNPTGLDAQSLIISCRPELEAVQSLFGFPFQQKGLETHAAMKKRWFLSEVQTHQDEP